MKRLFLFGCLVILALSNPIPAHAALIDNGGGLIYDTSLNVTWYNYSYTTGSSGHGPTWSEAMTWATGLNTGGVNGWYLPQALPINGVSYNWGFSYNGSTDVSYNITSPNSQMAYLYYVELGNKGYYTANGTDVPYPQSGWGLVNEGLLTNLYPTYYWSSNSTNDGNDTALLFNFGDGLQGTGGKGANGVGGTSVVALAVHNGDVIGNGVVLPNGPVVPIPGTMFLLGPVVVGILWFKKRMGREDGSTEIRTGEGRHDP